MVDYVHTQSIHTEPDVSDKDYQRLGVYFDAKMLEDEKVIAAELDRKGEMKVNRSSIIRLLLAKEANRIRRLRERRTRV